MTSKAARRTTEYARGGRGLRVWRLPCQQGRRSPAMLQGRGDMYVEAAISAEFRSLAAKADNEFEDFRRGLSPLADGDAILARSCVYSHLYDRYFLESAEKLLNELRWLQQTGRPHAPDHCQSIEKFQQARDGILTALITRFDEGAADAGEP